MCVCFGVGIRCRFVRVCVRARACVGVLRFRRACGTYLTSPYLINVIVVIVVLLFFEYVLSKRRRAKSDSATARVCVCVVRDDDVV